jgi:hypothetical protein
MFEGTIRQETKRPWEEMSEGTKCPERQNAWRNKTSGKKVQRDKRPEGQRIPFVIFTTYIFKKFMKI